MCVCVKCVLCSVWVCSVWVCVCGVCSGSRNGNGDGSGHDNGSGIVSVAMTVGLAMVVAMAVVIRIAVEAHPKKRKAADMEGSKSKGRPKSIVDPLVIKASRTKSRYFQITGQCTALLHQVKTDPAYVQLGQPAHRRSDGAVPEQLAEQAHTLHPGLDLGFRHSGAEEEVRRPLGGQPERPSESRLT